MGVSEKSRFATMSSIRRRSVFASGFVCPGCGRENRHIVVECKGIWLRVVCPECETAWAERVERIEVERKRQT